MSLLHTAAKDVRIAGGRISVSMGLVLVALIVAVPVGWYWLHEVADDVHNHKTTAVEVAHPEVATRLKALEVASIKASEAAVAAAEAAQNATTRTERLERRQMQVQFILERAFPEEARAARRAVSESSEDQ